MQDKTGLEDAQGVGAINGAALFTADIERLRAMAWEPLTAIHPGAAVVDTDFWHWKPPTDLWIEAVTISAYNGAPTGADLHLQLKIAGTLDTTIFVLPATAVTVHIPISGDGILVLANQNLKPQFTQVGSGSPGTNVAVILQTRKRVL